MGPDSTVAVDEQPLLVEWWTNPTAGYPMSDVPIDGRWDIYSEMAPDLWTTVVQECAGPC